MSILPGMSPHLVITAAVLCGHWARRFRCIMNNNTDPSKVDKTSDDGEIPISLNHGDRLTDLPDEILSYILTHLTLRDVVRMTTLSKRWKNIWLSLPKLDLEWSVMSRYTSFSPVEYLQVYKQVAYVKSVHKVLLDYDNQDISSFRISLSFTRQYDSHVDYWIRFASKKRLQSLTLQFISDSYYASLPNFRPENMYTITSSILSRFPCLKDLRLDVCNLKLHSDFRFNKLVRLDLYYVVLEENQLQWMLSTSSTIEWLRIRWCNLPEKLCIGENLQQLSSLMIHDLSELREIKLNAKSLNFFDFVGRAIVKFSFLSNAKLKSSHVALIDKNYKGAECIIRDLATSILSLETLLLEGSYSLLHLIPTHPSTLFRRVVRLSSIFKSEDPEVDIVKSFPRLLNSFRQLQKLYLMVPDTFLRRKYDLPDVCLNTSSIKEVELGNFQMDWIPCASYFLKSTVALDRMLISRHITKYTCEGEWKRSAAHSFSQQECDYIRLALQGNAISPNADLVIQ